MNEDDTSLGVSARILLPPLFEKQSAASQPHGKWITALRHGDRFDIAARWRDLTTSV